MAGTPGPEDFLPEGGLANKQITWDNITGNDISPYQVDGSGNRILLGGSLRYVVGGLGVEASGYFTPTATGNLTDALVVQDSGNDAGLGVYSTHLANDGSVTSGLDNSDDNVTGGSSRVETLRLVFDTQVTLTGLTFNDANHNGLTSGTFILDIDGSGAASRSFGASGSIVGTTFEFTYDTGTTGDQFYVATATASVPDGGTTAVLLGSALLGLGLIRRQRSRK